MAKKTWFDSTAERLEHQARRAGIEKFVCASGISPSGTIHLGNLREVMTTHLVVEALKRRGLDAEHIHSWDDYDRLRKVPSGVPEEYAEHIGRPLAMIPDPGGEYDSYADRHIAEFQRALDRLGISFRGIRQSVEYPKGTYRDRIKLAMAKRGEIFDILREYQTKGEHETSDEERRAAYFPFKVFCHSCGRDDTQVTAYDEATTEMTYTCQCGHEGSFKLDEEVPGKLVWKVDWPMRWQFENVFFEPGGEDHSSPGSSFTVGQRIVREVFGAEPPQYVGYAFVGVAGEAKISSSAGTAATPGVALRVLEPAMLRWMYARRAAGQAFTIDFGQEIVRLYDEWDRLVEKSAAGKLSDNEAAVFGTSVETSAKRLEETEIRAPFRVLSSAIDITEGSYEQVRRIVGHHMTDRDLEGVERSQLEPRYSCAEAWIETFLPDEERTHVKQEFDSDAWSALDDGQRAAVEKLVTMMGEHWSLDGLTTLVYGVPKLTLGLEMDAKPTPELKAAQRDFFIAIYSLLIGEETGPRIPSMFLSLGEERTKELLVP